MVTVGKFVCLLNGTCSLYWELARVIVMAMCVVIIGDSLKQKLDNLANLGDVVSGDSLKQKFDNLANLGDTVTSDSLRQKLDSLGDVVTDNVRETGMRAA